MPPRQTRQTRQTRRTRKTWPRQPKTSAKPAELITFALEWFLNPDHLPIVLAKEGGFFKEEGLHVSILVPTVPEESLDLVAHGKADFGVGEQTNVIRGRGLGQGLVSIAPLLEHTVVCLMYLKEGPIKRLENLRHRRVGWPGLAIDLPILDTMLAAAGLSREDIFPVDVGFGLTDALLTGKADAVFGAFVNYEQVEAEMRGAAVEFVSPVQYGVPDLYQLVIMTSDRVMKRRPDLVRRVTRALGRAYVLIQERPNVALLLYLKANQTVDPELSERTVRATLPYFPKTLKQDPRRWRAVRDWLHQRGVISVPMPLPSLFTNAFVPKSSKLSHTP